MRCAREAITTYHRPFLAPRRAADKNEASRCTRPRGYLGAAGPGRYGVEMYRTSVHYVQEAAEDASEPARRADPRVS